MFGKRYLTSLSFVVSLIIFSNCTQYKKIVYLQDQFTSKDSSLNYIPFESANNMVLNVDDNLFINIYGVDLGQLEIFTKQNSLNQNYTEYSLFMQGYVIDNNGNIELPIVGKIYLKGKTLAQAKESIQKSIDEYVVGAVVEVRLLSFQITLLGDVRKPGTYSFFNKEVNILDALGKAGDINDFGDRSNLLIIRKQIGKTTTFNVDLTSSDFFSNAGYWLEPNDIVYVKPLRAKMMSINGTTISVVLASVTTLILFLTYMRY